MGAILLYYINIYLFLLMSCNNAFLLNLIVKDILFMKRETESITNVHTTTGNYILYMFVFCFICSIKITPIYKFNF